ncbi:MAG: hypothetical protein KIT10_03415 [Flavobacteriales bacterium]|nr:hypothetical protein [Flavobacteriales bacterium]
MRSLILFLTLIASHVSIAQGVGINNPAPDPSALLDLTSTDKGLLVPRMTTAQRDGIPVPALSLLIFNTTNERFEYHNGSAWVPFILNTGWLTTGNAGTNAATNFVGTTDNVPLVLRTNNTEQLRIQGNGNVGIGVNAPMHRLDVQGDAFFRSAFMDPGLRISTNEGSLTYVDLIGEQGFTSGGIRLRPRNIVSDRYLYMAPSGQIGIATIFPEENLHVVGNIRMVDGNQAAGRVMVSDFFGTATWTDPSGLGGGTLDDAYDFGGPGAGRTITADAGAVRVEGTDGLQVTGTLNSGATLDLAGPGTRMFFHPRKAAFRAGQVAGAQWDDASVGVRSTAWGLNTTASADGSTAWGDLTVASGALSTAWGLSNTAAYLGTVWGYENLANGTQSTAWGEGNSASSYLATAWGEDNIASDHNTTVWGRLNQATAIRSTAWGSNNLASGNGSTAWGGGNQATENYATAWGSTNQATELYSTAFGSLNQASEVMSTAWGFMNQVSGNMATGWGMMNIASGALSTVWGRESTASGLHATAWGNGNIASGEQATAWGEYNNASGHRATAWGFLTAASGVLSSAFGRNHVASSYGETVLGIGATAYTPSVNGATQFRTANANDRLLVVGNAIDANNNDAVDAAERSNALLILKNGNTTIGNANPNTRLDVVAGTTGTITRVMTVRSAFTANNTGTGIALINSTGNASDVGSEIISVTTNATSGLSDLRFHVHGGGGANGPLDERMRILGNGNVGIG